MRFLSLSAVSRITLIDIEHTQKNSLAPIAGSIPFVQSVSYLRLLMATSDVLNTNKGTKERDLEYFYFKKNIKNRNTSVLYRFVYKHFFGAEIAWKGSKNGTVQ